MDLTVLLDFLSGPFAYPAFIFIMITSGMGSPLNGDLVLLFVGSLSGLGYLSPYALIPLGIFGLFIGESVLFLLSRRFGFRLLKIWPFSKFLKPAKIYKVNRLLKNRGPLIVFYARFIPGTRTATFITSGIFKMSYKKFAPYSLLGLSCLIPFYVLVGNLFVSNLEEAKQSLPKLLVIVFLLGLIIFSIKILGERIRRSSVPESSDT